MATGLYYYKLISPYPDDVTKNCKLTVNEIDSNFLTLKDNDIKTAEFIREDKTLILTKNDGEKIIAPLNDVTYNLEVSTGSTKSGMSLTIKYDCTEGEKIVTVNNILTYDNLRDVIGTDVLTKVITNNTLKGNGTMDSPLSLAGVEKTGSYAPVIGVIDTTKGNSLPEVAKLGTRYVTKEWVNDYGFLYNGDGVKEISEKLDIDKRGWRVPSKADWDALLNSIEPCKYRNHTSAKCHVELGKIAGLDLKTECGWVGQPDCECTRTKPFTGCVVDDDVDYADDDNMASPSDEPSEKPCGPGIDKYGMSILPAGAATVNTFGQSQTTAFKESAYFWTTSHINEDLGQDIYVKRFDWNKCGVYQIADCPSPYYSVRLVKDFDGSNYVGTVDFDGITYDTLLFAESGQIWLASNYAGKQNISYKNYTEVNGGEVLEKRTEYYINEWNGKYWERKRMNEADTVVVENPVYDCSGKTVEVCWEDGEGVKHCVDVDIPTISQNNIEYRVYTENESCDKILVNVDGAVVERVLNVVLPMLEQERVERISADTELWEALSAETEERISAETELWDAISAETDERIAADEELSGAIDTVREDLEAETERAISAETILDEKIDEEIERAISAETALDEKIDEESERAISAETALDEKIDEEIERATEREDEIEQELFEEIERATATEAEISGLTIVTSDDKNPYTLRVSANEDDENSLTLESKDGNPDHFIKIKLDGNFGEI